MKVQRGDVVLLNYPYSGGGGSKVRPALVVQDNTRNQQLSNTIVVMITGNVSRAQSDPTQLLISTSTPDGERSGLRRDSAITCGNLFTIDEQVVRKKIGDVSDATMSEVELCLKAALAIS